MSALVLSDATAAPGNETAIVAKVYHIAHFAAHHHGDVCCIPGDASKDAGPTGDACMIACCSAVSADDVIPIGSAEATPVVPLVPIPASAGRDGSHPPPRSDCMT